ncbi:unnamed protein product [Amoebophrya sp. A25]|nr:unnamed protein product [Amoebophrya sp. A25]|eukprot:GSA25T00012597001.1
MSAPTLRAVVVTGGNKGIGLAICDKILKDNADTFLFLGSRDKGRGEAAVEGLSNPSRATALLIDPCDAGSIKTAAATVQTICADKKMQLWGLLNNAGGMGAAGKHLGSDVSGSELRLCVKLNFTGCVLVTEAFLPILGACNGFLPRIVNVNSGAGPGFFANASEELVAKLMDRTGTTAPLEALADGAAKAFDCGGDNDAVSEQLQGIGCLAAGMRLGGRGQFAYCLSKGLMNAWTRQVAHQQKGKVLVNSCSPGFVITDLTAPMCEARGKTPQQMNMLTPEEGARTPCYLLLDADITFTGRFYGSDGKRSPFHTRRDPDNDPEYEAPAEEEI